MVISSLARQGKVQRLFRKEVRYKCIGSAQHPLKDDDIVRSLKKFKAAKKMKYLYQLKNKISGSVYFGITNNPKQRWHTHKNCAKNTDRKSPIYDAIRSYGIDNFEMEILESSEDAQYIANREIELIASTKNYNLHSGGHIGFDVRTKGREATEQWIAKMKIKRAGRTPALGMRHSEKTKKLCGEYAKLRWDMCGRYPEEILNFGFVEANKKYGISKTHYYRLRKAALANELA